MKFQEMRDSVTECGEEMRSLVKKTNQLVGATKQGIHVIVNEERHPVLIKTLEKKLTKEFDAFMKQNLDKQNDDGEIR